MPDPAPAKRRAQPAPSRDAAPAGPPYAELHAKSNFSFLEGASHPDELVNAAVAQGYAALAVTDRHTLAGVVRAHVAARECGLKFIVGAELHPLDGLPLVLWAPDRAAYAKLSRLLTRGCRQAPKGECRLTSEEIAEGTAGLIAGVVPSETSSSRTAADGKTIASEGAAPTREPYALAVEPRQQELLKSVSRYREILGDRCYLLAELHAGPDDDRRTARLLELSRRARVPLVAAGDVHYHAAQRQALHDVLVAIRHGVPVGEADGLLFANAECYLQPRENIVRRYRGLPGAVERTVEVAGRCEFSLDELRYEYPEELCPAGQRPIDYLRKLAWVGAGKRYPAGIPDKVRGLIEHELALIEELEYEAYFLTVWDLVRFARGRGILCQGRGSAANSAVCYALGVTSVDPSRIDLLFERFVSRERNEAPDIDLDFEHERREEVLQYVYDKYGRDRAGITAEVITYRPRSAVRDVGKALGLSLDRVDALAKVIDGYRDGGQLAERAVEAGIDPSSETGRRLLELVHEIQGFPRHLSQHVGGMVITRGPLEELVPIENAAMPGRTVIQWDKDDLDRLGILKVDCLALGMLTAIHRAFDLLEKHTARRWTLATVPAEDRRVYDMICRADTVGVFQIESRAQMSMLPRLRPRSFYDLVIEVAIVRPGPIQGNMVHPFLRRRSGEEAVEYPNEAVREVLQKTLGVPIFQEQAMRLAIVAAGFSPGEADQLRRAMGAWRRPGIIDNFRRRLIEGMQARGLAAEFAERVFEQLRGFGEYGFPESHAASFALLVYVSAWIKHYHPAAFTAALLNSQPMGFYAPAQLVRDAREHGVAVRPIDVNASDWDCTLEATSSSSAAERFALRLGLRMIAGLPQAAADAIVAARATGVFRSLADLARRARLSQAVLSRLAAADAFGSLELDRRNALWQALASEPELPLFAELDNSEGDESAGDESAGGAAGDVPVDLPALTPAAEVRADYRTAGLSLRAHPISFLRADLDELRVLRSVQLASWPVGRQVRVAGLVLMRQRPSTAKGITFVTLEDETGQANLIVRSEIWLRYHRAARTATAMIAHGKLERQGRVIHVVVNRIDDLSERLQALRVRSRDFH
ncbi:MAG: error-prone DNA polymerase [Pirellulales bacterium]